LGVVRIRIWWLISLDQGWCDQETCIIPFKTKTSGLKNKNKTNTPNESHMDIEKWYGSPFHQSSKQEKAKQSNCL